MAAYVLTGTLVGTQVLAYADARNLRSMLAAMIVVYLLQARAPKAASAGPLLFPRLAPLIFGMLGGFFAGTVNVALPPLLRYFSSLALTPVVMTQALTLSLLVGRVTQAVAVTSAGRWSLALIWVSLPLCLIAVPALAAGFRLQHHIRPNTFLLLLRAVLWAMATILVGQVVRSYFR